MPVPSLSLSSSSSPSSPSAVIVIGARVSDGAAEIVASDGYGPTVGGYDGVAAQLIAVGFTGGRDELVRLPGVAGGHPIAVIGLPHNLDGDALRYAAGSAVRQLAGVESVTIALPLDDRELVAAVLEGAALGSYAFTEYRHASTAAVKAPVSTIEVVVADDDADQEGIVRATAVAQAVSLVKDLVNTPPLDLYPETLA